VHAPLAGVAAAGIGGKLAAKAWDEQMKRDIAAGKLDTVLREVEEDIKAGRVREMP
jgi:hypothetical protein